MALPEYHAQRRRQVAEAVERLIVAGGIDEVTIAKTAAEAGASVGLVQHYFRSKDKLLRHVYEQVTERVLNRVLEHARAIEEHRGRVQDAVRAGLVERLPLDRERRQEWRVYFAFTARAVDVEALATARSRTEAQIAARLTQAIDNGKRCGEVAADTDSATTATELLALVDGVALRAYLDPDGMPADAALAAVDRRLDLVFPGRCGHYDRA